MTAQQLGALALMHRWHLWADDLAAAADALDVARLSPIELLAAVSLRTRQPGAQPPVCG